MKNWFVLLFLTVFSTQVFAVNFDSIGEVPEEEEVVEEAPAPKPAPVAKKKMVPAKKSSHSTTQWSLGLLYNPLGSGAGVDPANGMDPRVVEGNLVVSGGVSFSPSYRLLANLGYNSLKDETITTAATSSIENSVITIGIGFDYFLSKSPVLNSFLAVSVDYLMTSKKVADVKTDATAYVIGFGVGAEYQLSPAFSLGTDLRLKYGVGEKKADNPTVGAPGLKKTGIWFAPALRLIWNL